MAAGGGRRTLDNVKNVLAWPLLIATTLAALVFSGMPAQAGPTPDQPATAVVTKRLAYKVVDYVMTDLMRTMPRPRRYVRDECVGLGNPKLLRCPVEWFTPDSKCSATLWVWADHEDHYYYEWHQMRCS